MQSPGYVPTRLNAPPAEPGKYGNSSLAKADYNNEFSRAISIKIMVNLRVLAELTESKIVVIDLAI